MSARSSAKRQLPATTDENPSTAAKILSQIIERGARVQAPAVKAYVDRLRQHNGVMLNDQADTGTQLDRRGRRGYRHE